MAKADAARAGASPLSARTNVTNHLAARDSFETPDFAAGAHWMVGRLQLLSWLRYLEVVVIGNVRDAND